jgi:predicted AAA+ superfamily ATPase
VKSYYDMSKKLKFLVSGSSSLFVKKKTRESLAGRIIEISVPPLKFKEYLKIKKVLQDDDFEKTFRFQKDLINAYFCDYLVKGQFPQAVSGNYDEKELKEYLFSIEEKIIDQDLPKLYNIKEVDILKLLFEYVKRHVGQTVEFQNLSQEMGVDYRTIKTYFYYLEKSYLINLCKNKTKKILKFPRTAKKIYLNSTNFTENAKENIGNLAENYVFNFYSNQGYQVEFFRSGNFEVDFVLKDINDEVFPVEVKYQPKILEKDYRNLIKLAKKMGSKKAICVTKDLQAEKTIFGVKTFFIPAVLLESSVDFTKSRLFELKVIISKSDAKKIKKELKKIDPKTKKS